MRVPAAAVIAELVTLSLSAGCASSPAMNYYTLTEAPAAARLPTAAGTVPVHLDRITIPTELDRSQLVRRIDATRLQIVENDRWAAPLEDTIRRVLAGDLASRLPPGVVANPNEPSIGEKRQSLAVDIQEFYADAACTVTLHASWVLKQADSQTTPGAVDARIPTSGPCSGAATIPAAMSQALGQLADEIAQAVAHPAARPSQ